MPSLAPDFAQRLHPFVVIPPALAEISIVLYLLVTGVKTMKPEQRVLAAQ